MTHPVGMIQAIATWGTLIAAVVTAVATFFLWRVTGILAVETKRMADASAQPQVVATIEPNLWSTMHFDIDIANTGNATAFDVEVSFDPPLNSEDAEGDGRFPFQRISVLKPGQAMRSYLNEAQHLLQNRYTVTTSWKLNPVDDAREVLIIDLNMRDYTGVSYLGARNPLVQVADELKKLREDWRSVASGSKRIRVDSFSQQDRDRESDLRQERYRQMKAQEAQANSDPGAAGHSETDAG